MQNSIDGRVEETSRVLPLQESTRDDETNERKKGETRADDEDNLPEFDGINFPLCRLGVLFVVEAMVENVFLKGPELF